MAEDTDADVDLKDEASGETGIVIKITYGGT